ncbi:unnamed protein product [Rhodiola kirilowii]
MVSWVRTITSPFRACTFFNHQQHQSREKKCQPGEYDNRILDLHGEVMACPYQDVQVMWSILDKTNSRACSINAS